MRRRSLSASPEEPIVLDRILNNNTWRAIAYVAESPGFGELTDSQIEETYGWKIGDTKDITIMAGRVDTCEFEGGVYKAMILGFNHNRSIEGQGIQFAIISDTMPYIMRYVRMNPLKSNVGGWEDCRMRTVYLQQFKLLLPNSLRCAIKKTVKYTDNMGGIGEELEENVTATEEDIFLMSEFEYFGRITKSNSYEQYKQARYKYLTEYSVLGSDNRCFRSPASPVLGKNGEFCNVSWNMEDAGTLDATRDDLYIIPCFRV